MKTLSVQIRQGPYLDSKVVETEFLALAIIIRNSEDFRVKITRIQCGGFMNEMAPDCISDYLNFCGRGTKNALIPCPSALFVDDTPTTDDLPSVPFTEVSTESIFQTYCRS